MPEAVAVVEVVAEPEPERETGEAATAEPETEPAARTPKLSSTIRRLLWGVNARSGD